MSLERPMITLFFSLLSLGQSVPAQALSCAPGYVRTLLPLPGQRPPRDVRPVVELFGYSSGRYRFALREVGAAGGVETTIHGRFFHGLTTVALHPKRLLKPNQQYELLQVKPSRRVLSKFRTRTAVSALNPRPLRKIKAAYVAGTHRSVWTGARKVAYVRVKVDVKRPVLVAVWLAKAGKLDYSALPDFYRRPYRGTFRFGDVANECPGFSFKIGAPYLNAQKRLLVGLRRVGPSGAFGPKQRATINFKRVKRHK